MSRYSHWSVSELNDAIQRIDKILKNLKWLTWFGFFREHKQFVEETRTDIINEINTRN